MFSRDRPAEQRRLLGHEPDLPAQAGHGHVADVDAVDPDRARRDVPQARDRARPAWSCPTRTARPGRGSPLPGSSSDDVAQRPGDPAGTRTTRRRARSAPATAADRPGVGRVEDRRPRVDDLEHALDGPGPLAELAVQARDRCRGSPRSPRRTAGTRSASRSRASPSMTWWPGVPEQRGDGAEPEEAHERPEPRPPQRQPRPGRDDACAGRRRSARAPTPRGRSS